MKTLPAEWKHHLPEELGQVIFTRSFPTPRVPENRLEERLPAQLLLLLPNFLKDIYLGPM